MDGCVEVVDDLRADGRLREHELNGGLRVARVAFDDGDEGVVRSFGFQPRLLDTAGEDAGESGLGGVAPVELVARLTAGVAACV